MGGLVLDVAHLSLSGPEEFDKAFVHPTESYADRIDHVHLCDATAEDDHRQLYPASDKPLTIECYPLRTAPSFAVARSTTEA